MASETAISKLVKAFHWYGIGDKPIPLSAEKLVAGEIGTPDFSSLDTSVPIGGVEGVREKVFARGPKWVSFSSINTRY